MGTGLISSAYRAALLVFAAVAMAACDRVVDPPKRMASYTFSQLEAQQPIGFKLAETGFPTLLVRTEGRETAFETRIRNAEGDLLSVARLPYLRAGPVFQVIELGPESGPVNFSVTPQYLTKNSIIGIQVMALSVETELEAIRAHSLSSYEQAIQSTSDESAEVWGKRVKQMRLAAAGFASSGETEAQLWANYLEAYFHYFPLANYKTAVDMAKRVQGRARRAELPEIEVMAMQLEAQALIERDKKDSTETTQRKHLRAQKLLKSAVNLAAELDLQFERAWAINSRGISYFYQDRYAEAEKMYEKALGIALEIEDDYLQGLARSNIALSREKLGDLNSALSMLLDINIQLQDSGSTAELAHNWSELGRLYNKLFMFPEAVEALSQALELSRDARSIEGLARNGSSLAYAYYEMGYMGRALETTLAAIEDMEVSHYGRGFREAYQLLADIYRYQGDYSSMSEARARQGQHLSSDIDRAHYLYGQGLDATAHIQGDLSAAEGFFAEAQEVLEEVPGEGLGLRLRLQLCLIHSAEEPVPDACECSRLAIDLEQWLPTATPRQALEARFLLARIMIDQGDEAQAIGVLEVLIDDIQHYRMSLPGVLGAWYWERRSQVFRTYLELMLRQSGSDQNPFDSLQALHRIQNVNLINAEAARSVSESPDVSIEMRSLLIRLEEDETNRLEIRQAIDRNLLSGTAGSGKSGPALDRQDLISAIHSLPPDSALLSYYLSEQGSWAWVADRSGVNLVQLDESTNIISALRRVRKGLRVIGDTRLDQGLAALGELLVTPLEHLLPRKIYLLATGELAGFPFEALKQDGHYFGKDHEVINLMTLVGLLKHQKGGDGATAWDNIFLAGNPLDNDHKAQLPGAFNELDGIARLFEGSDVTMAQGGDLEFDSIGSPAFGQARLIHFASHAEINLEYPELSKLMLSGIGNYLTPLDIRTAPLTAHLVVLSACETTGVNSFTYDSNMGFVTELLQAGAGAVVASLWPVSDTFTQEFMSEFYSTLLSDVSASEALAQTKQKYINGDNPSGNLDWASFQIYINHQPPLSP